VNACPAIASNSLHTRDGTAGFRSVETVRPHWAARISGPRILKAFSGSSEQRKVKGSEGHGRGPGPGRLSPLTT